MTSQTLTERYVAAAMRTVPESQRDDLSSELRASIQDQVDARVESGEDAHVAERAVLTELGDPDKLAAGYTDRVLWLIGPRYFLDWWRLLKVLLWIVPVCVMFGVSLGQTLAGAGIGTIIGTTVGATIASIAHVFFWTTLVFAIIERSPMASRTGQAADDQTSAAGLAPWSLDNLPEPRQQGASFGDLVASIVGLIIGVGAVLWDQFIGFVPGIPISFINPGLWPWWIGGLFVMMVLTSLLQLAVYLRGRWTSTLAGINAALAVVVTAPAVWLLIEGRLLNPEFFPTIIPGSSGPEVQGIVTVLTGFAIAGSGIWSIIDAFLKARRAR